MTVVARGFEDGGSARFRFGEWQTVSDSFQDVCGSSNSFQMGDGDKRQILLEV